MSINNQGLPFTAHNAQKFDIRSRPDKYAMSPLGRFDFEQGEGIRPPEYYAPYKYLPVGFKDVNLDDYVVIPKGRILAAFSAEDTTLASGMKNPASSGMINIGLSASELGGAAIAVGIDTSIWGYDDYINSLVGFANGGAIYSGFYTADDVTAKTMKAEGTLVASGGTPFATPANAPIGVAFHDWYQDIRGKYLNYRMWTDGGHVLADWCVSVPFVKVSNSTYSGVNPQYQNSNYANLTKWWDINKQFTYLTVDETANDVFRNGVFVQSDLIGNYKIQGGASALSQNRTVQTVGKIIGIDCRFPKSSLEDVVTHPRSGMPGTQTAGIPKYLFDFVYKSLSIGGFSPTIEDVYNAIRSGRFGMAHIQLSVS